MRTKYRWGFALAGLLATAAACSDDSGTGPAQPAVMIAASTQTQDGTVGVVAAAAPAVRVSDARGGPVAGVPVTFAVTAGGGMLAALQATTGPDGIAMAGTWTLGTTVGQNTVTVTAAGLPPVVFNARARAGAPASLVTHAGTGQTALAGRAVAVAPAVRVLDAYGNGVPGIPVAFAASAGGGTLVDGTVSSDTNGVAAVSRWSLGAPGPNTLTASVGALRATFTATALDPCTESVAYTFGAAAAGELDAFDCRLSSGQRVDFFNMPLPEARSFTVEMQGGGVPFLYLFDTTGRVLAAESSRTDTAQMWVLSARAGSYLIGASSSATGPGGPVPGGAYSIRTAPSGTDVAGCAKPWLLMGVAISTNQRLTSDDACHTTNRYGDAFQVYLRAGQAISIRHDSQTFDTYLWLLGPNGSIVASNDDYNGLNAFISYTAPAAGAYTILASSYSTYTTGGYTLSVQ